MDCKTVPTGGKCGTGGISKPRNEPAVVHGLASFGSMVGDGSGFGENGKGGGCPGCAPLANCALVGRANAMPGGTMNCCSIKLCGGRCPGLPRGTGGGTMGLRFPHRADGIAYGGGTGTGALGTPLHSPTDVFNRGMPNAFAIQSGSKGCSGTRSLGSGGAGDSAPDDDWVLLAGLAGGGLCRCCNSSKCCCRAASKNPA